MGIGRSPWPHRAGRAQCISPRVLQQAVEAALLHTHDIVHPEGADGAYFLAHAVIRMSKMTPQEAAAGAWKMALLQELLQVVTTDKARNDLNVVKAALADGVSDDLAVATQLHVTPNVRSRHATETVCCALWVLLQHWRTPAVCLSKT